MKRQRRTVYVMLPPPCFIEEIVFSAFSVFNITLCVNMQFCTCLSAITNLMVFCGLGLWLPNFCLTEYIFRYMQKNRIQLRKTVQKKSLYVKVFPGHDTHQYINIKPLWEDLDHIQRKKNITCSHCVYKNVFWTFSSLSQNDSLLIIYSTKWCAQNCFLSQFWALNSSWAVKPSKQKVMAKCSQNIHQPTALRNQISHGDEARDTKRERRGRFWQGHYKRYNQEPA